ncbi:hypothetical protein B0H14DRAFT_3461931 [Mycena olivaceomarginata]|nr:hypothetical protein B0H14DRAFT_3461931 [Mycena olivaceomarginata]
MQRTTSWLPISGRSHSLLSSGRRESRFCGNKPLKIGFRAGHRHSTEGVRAREASENYALGCEASPKEGRTGGLRDGKQDGRKAGKLQGLKEGEVVGIEKGKTKLAPPPPPSSAPLHAATQTDASPSAVVPSIVPGPPLSWADESYHIYAPDPTPDCCRYLRLYKLSRVLRSMGWAREGGAAI